jgi:predicted permease
MLLLLGIQLSQTTLTGAQTVVWRSLLIRLGLSPVVALALCLWIGIGGVERQAMVLQAAMPTAVVTTVLSTEFAAAPRLVAAAVLASTLVSLVTVSLLLAVIT